jgi:acetyltransferase-like isoleucine patch superfamily enzyme
MLVSEKISAFDVVFKYTLRDLLIGSANVVPGTLGVGLRLLLYKLFLRRCGGGVMFKPFITLNFPERIKMGNHVSVNEYTAIDGDGGVTIGDFTRISYRVTILSHILTYANRKKPIKLQKKQRKPVAVGRDVLLGAGCTIMPGVTIGDGAVVGAGAVVTKDVKAYSIVAGVPAKVVAKR